MNIATGILALLLEWLRWRILREKRRALLEWERIDDENLKLEKEMASLRRRGDPDSLAAADRMLQRSVRRSSLAAGYAAALSGPPAGADISRKP